MKKKYDFTIKLKVRDYECDLQGIVNNAVYQNYLEHTRHEFMEIKGLNFEELHHQGIDLVVARLEMAFKTPLKSRDVFISCMNVKKNGIKYIFEQDIYRESDNLLCIKAKVTTVGLINGKLGPVAEVDALF